MIQEGEGREGGREEGGEEEGYCLSRSLRKGTSHGLCHFANSLNWYTNSAKLREHVVGSRNRWHLLSVLSTRYVASIYMQSRNMLWIVLFAARSLG